MDFNKVLGEKAYMRLKWLVTIVLPATSALYFGLAGVWDLPNAENVVGTIAVVTTFLGVILGISTTRYNNQNMGDGQIVVTPPSEDGEDPGFALQLEKTPQELEMMSRVTFKVIHE